MAIFGELNPREEYFPMVSRVGDMSIFGMPPSPIAPQPKTQSPLTSHNDRLALRSREANEYISEEASAIAQPSTVDVEMNVDESDEDHDYGFALATSSPGLATSSPSESGQMLGTPSAEERSGPPSRGHGELGFHQDAEAWLTWHDNELLQTFSQLLPRRETKNLVRGPWYLLMLTSQKNANAE